MGRMYFGQKYYSAGRGYGYVAARRLRTREGSFLFGNLRRTDFLPVGGEEADEVLDCSYESLSDDDNDGRGLEYACEGNSSVFDCLEDASAPSIDTDFL